LREKRTDLKVRVKVTFKTTSTIVKGKKIYPPAQVIIIIIMKEAKKTHKIQNTKVRNIMGQNYKDQGTLYPVF
jgi:hypothetical protein